MMNPITRCSAAAMLALSALAGTGSAHAQSSVTLYGLMAVEGLRATNVITPTGGGSQFRLDSSQVAPSRIGFRGVEDLGGGMAALFGMESAIGADTGTASSPKFWNRGSYVGLRNGLGTLTAGRVWNLNDDLMGSYFVFGGYSAFRWTEFGYLSDLVDNAVKYVSPTFGGFQLRAIGALGEGTTGRTFEIGGEYKIGGFSAAGTWRDMKNASKTASDKLASAGASYDFGVARVHAGYAVSVMKTQRLPKAKTWDVGVVFVSSPALFFTADYVARDQVGTKNDSNFIRLGADYSFSKRTGLMANFVLLNNKGNASERFYGNGAAGRDQRVLSLGMRHLF